MSAGNVESVSFGGGSTACSVSTAGTVAPLDGVPSGAVLRGGTAGDRRCRRRPRAPLRSRRRPRAPQGSAGHHDASRRVPWSPPCPDAHASPAFRALIVDIRTKCPSSADVRVLEPRCRFCERVRRRAAGCGSAATTPPRQQHPRRSPSPSGSRRRTPPDRRTTHPVRPTAAGSAATASSEPARATALLTPLAMPAWSSGAAASTVEVSGATITARPSPKTVSPGSTSTTYRTSAPSGTSISAPSRHHQRPDRHRDPWTDPGAERPEPRGQEQHAEGDRQHRDAGLRARRTRPPSGAGAPRRR